MTRIIEIMADESEDKEQIPNIRTFKHDLAETLGQEDVSVASVAIQEQQRRYQAEETTTKEIRSSKTLVIAISALVFLGMLVLSYVLFLRQSPAITPVTLTPKIPAPLVQAELQTLFELSGKSPTTVYRELAGKVSASGHRPDTLEEIVPVLTSSSSTGALSETVSIEQFFQALDVRVPERFMRFLDKRYMYGIYTFRDTNAFLLVKPTSFGPVFAELLEWESEMPEIFYPLFTNKELSSTVVGPEPGALVWNDEVIRNIDSRVARDGTGQVVLLYSFLPSKEELIITPSIDTFTEVLSRSQSPKSVVQ